jgi:RNA recognition motif-containing protein
LNCDEHGKSKGVATVEYKNSEDASKAAKLYHERTLDGRAMKIEVVVNAGAARAMAAAP